MIIPEWFTNKSIAVVGNAQSLFDTEYGTLIDSHDIVCRLNKGTKALSRISHGNKLDVVFASRWYLVKYFYKKYIIKHNAYTDVKFIMCSRQGRTDLTHTIKQDIWYYPLDRYSEFKGKVLGLSKKQGPSTGIMALDIISYARPKSVSIFGFDWKKTPTFYDLERTHEPHLYDLEKEYCLNYFVKQLGYKHYI